MWFLILVVAVVVGLVSVGIRSDLQRRRRTRLLGDMDFATRDRRIGERVRPDAVARAEVEMRTRAGDNFPDNYGGF
jgi:hypothetical protein